MKSNDLYLIIVKVFGLFFIKSVVFSIVQDITRTIYLIASYGQAEATLAALGMSFAITAAYIYTAWLLLFRTQLIVDKLKLTEGVSEDITISLHRSSVLSIAIIVLGGYTFICAVTDFIQQANYYFTIKNTTFDSTLLDKTGMVKAGVQMTIGIILIVYQRVIVNFIEHKRKK
jgi:hypothetical protein